MLTSPKYKETIREATVHHSYTGQFSIRKGDWKLLLANHSGGWSYPQPSNKKALEGQPKYQLYNLKEDIAENVNLAEKHPEKVAELEQLMIQYIEQGRSTKGLPQKNDQCAQWRQLDYFIKQQQ